MPEDRILDQAATIVSWLHRQALEGAAAGTILEGLCARLVAGDLDLERAIVAFMVFHPQFDAINFAWSRDTGRAERHTVTWQLILRSTPSPFAHMHGTGTEELRYRLEDGEAKLPFPILEQLQSRGLTDYFAFFQPFGGSVDPQFWPDLPSGVTIREGITGSFATARAGGFHRDELAALRVLAPPLALAVKTAAAHEMAEMLLGTYLGAASGRNVLRGRVRRGQGEVIHAVVWHSDLRDSTALAETVPLEVYLATLNAYFDCVIEAVAASGGEVLKLIGDGLLAIFPFGAGTRAGEEACRQALAAAREALGRLAEVNARRAEAGMTEIRCGIALHAGDIMYGNVGSARRLDFTVTGTAVNEVFRLETLCKVLAVPLVISEAVAALYPEQLRPLGQHTLPGVGRAIKVFSLPGPMEG
ncbi:adenylate/guanylate cyclase domain-containing protein [Rhodospirillaceae bacterium SYSU D60014]|uniref:adenylate/guanylate cyclase domain-containing protein n=1 Tax=Virgifigura deserti TaxID=2268457 RepID=UPI000E664632